MKELKRISLIFFFILLLIFFIVSYYSFISINYLTPNYYQSSFLIYSGFFLLIFCLLLIPIIKPIKKRNLVEVNLISEKWIKLLLIIIMSIIIFIPRVSFSSSIISWNEINILNYLRSIIFIIISSYIPGSCIYNIIFRHNDVLQNININKVILKITIYPLISFSILGILILLLDLIGFNDPNHFLIVLYFIFISLYIIDLNVSDIKNKECSDFKVKYVLINDFAFIILICSLGISLISFAVFLEQGYPLTGDEWNLTGYSIYIEKGNLYDIIREIDYLYPCFWPFIVYGISVLTGLPIINSSAILFPFCYLYLTSTYILMRALLIKMDKIYAILSTILFSISAPLLCCGNDLSILTKANIFVVGVIYFNYKGFAYYLLFTALALIILSTITKKEFNRNTLKKKYDVRLLFIGTFLLFISYLIYLLPLMIGLIFIILFILFSKNKNQNFILIKKFMIILTAFMFIFDILFSFNLSYLFIYRFESYLIRPIIDTGIYDSDYRLILYIITTYSILGSLILIFHYLSKSTLSIDKLKKQLRTQNKNSIKKLLYFILLIFALVFIRFFFLLLNLNNINLQDEFIFIHMIDIILINIGIVGFVGIMLAYYCYMKDAYLFKFLSFSILVFSILSLSGFFFELISNPLGIISQINNEKLIQMYNWFDRNWFYLMIPLSILGSIGLIDFYKYSKEYIVSMKKVLCIKSIINYLFIYLSLTNLIITSSFYLHSNKLSNSEAQIMGWVSENLPDNSNLLLPYIYPLYQGIHKVSTINTYSVDQVIDFMTNSLNFRFWQIYNMDFLCNAQDLEYEGSNVLLLSDMNETGHFNIRNSFKNIQDHGTIKFSVKFNQLNGSLSYFQFSGYTGGLPILIRINSGYLETFNGNNWIQLEEIQINIWYNFQLDFECRKNGNYEDLSQYHYNIYLNGTKFENLKFYSNRNYIKNMQIVSSKSGFVDLYYKTDSYSWDENYKDSCPTPEVQKVMFINFLINSSIKFSIFKDISEYLYVQSNYIQGYLIPKFYNLSLYEYQGYNVYYAPYFN